MQDYENHNLPQSQRAP